MPDWFANRMYFSAESAQIAAIKRLASKDDAAAPFLPGHAGMALRVFKYLTVVSSAGCAVPP